MARLASVAKAGFYATAEDVLEYLSDLITTEGVSKCQFYDPCAGEGKAIQFLADKHNANFYVCEMESDRYKDAIKGASEGKHCDAFTLTFLGSVGFLYLNPPYDYDEKYGRLEASWLDRFSSTLCDDGVLMFIVPHYVLDKCSDILAERFYDIKVLKFPEPSFQDFKQVVVIAKKSSMAIDDSDVAANIAAFAKTTNIPVLGETRIERYPIRSTSWFRQTLHRFDVSRCYDDYEPWGVGGRPLENSQFEPPTRSQRFELASVPKPSYIAAALAAGVFDGVVLRSDNDNLPPLITKGTFTKSYKPIDEKLDENGEVIAIVEVQRPELQICVLDLTTGEYHTLERTTDEISNTDVSKMSCGDLITNYSQALVDALYANCNILHNSSTDTAEGLPAFVREPYPAQAHAIKTLTKLLSKDNRCAWLMGEIGSGKTTVSLNTAIAMGAKKTLVMAPPHLVAQWETEQIPAIWPDAATHILDSIPAIDKFMADDRIAIGILSREAAKLGHSWEGVGKKCPKCGSTTNTTASNAAKKRLHCKSVTKIPHNDAARLSNTLSNVIHLSSVKDTVRGCAQEIFNILPSNAVRTLLIQYMNDDEFTRKYANCTEHAHLTNNEDLFNELVAKNDHYYKPIFGRVPYYMTVEADGTRTVHGDKPGAKKLLRKVIKSLEEEADFSKKPCMEPLYQAVPSPRRYPLAKYISKKYKNSVDFLIIDEAHELGNASSAQSKAGQQLYNLNCYKIAMTGSTMNGYASTLFLPLWFFNKSFRSEFGYNDQNNFIKKYGYLKRVGKERDVAVSYGEHTNREIKYSMSGQAPGVLPSLLLSYFLRNTVTLHINDLGIDLPPCSEDVIRVNQLVEQRDKCETIKGQLVNAISRDAFTERAGALFGQMGQLPSCYDRITEDVGNNPKGTYLVAYPPSYEEPPVIEVSGLPSDIILPKEKKLLEILKSETEQGRNVLVLMWNVSDDNSGERSLCERVRALAEAQLGIKVPYLNAKKVSAKKRVAWIQKNVVGKDRKVLFAQPSAIKTGINNLVHFSTIVFYQNPGCSPEIRRQVKGRIVRVGQTKETKIITLIYNSSVQEYSQKLLMHKVAVSEYTDGLDPQQVLAASGVSDDSDMVGTDIGKAIYKMLTK